MGWDVFGSLRSIGRRAWDGISGVGKRIGDFADGIHASVGKLPGGRMLQGILEQVTEGPRAIYNGLAAGGNALKDLVHGDARGALRHVTNWGKGVLDYEPSILRAARDVHPIGAAIANGVRSLTDKMVPGLGAARQAGLGALNVVDGLNNGSARQALGGLVSGVKGAMGARALF